MSNLQLRFVSGNPECYKPIFDRARRRRALGLGEAELGLPRKSTLALP